METRPQTPAWNTTNPCWALGAITAAELAYTAQKVCEKNCYGLRAEVAEAINGEPDFYEKESFYGVPELRVEPYGRYGSYLWIEKPLYGAIRIAAETATVDEVVRLTGYLESLLPVGQERGYPEGKEGRPRDARDLAVPYEEACGEEETHILLYRGKVGDVGECVGHLPATGTYKERIAAARATWDFEHDE